jgi:hypothetical protein
MVSNNSAFFGNRIDEIKRLGATRAKISPTSNVDKIFSKMYIPVTIK